jgi:hypothetical protein
MPKYTNPITFTGTPTISSSDWNKYFGSDGNVQWLYDEYENVSSLNAVAMFNAVIPAVGANVVARATNYGVTRGDAFYANKTTGVLTSPVYTGYVWLSAQVSHTVTSGNPVFYIQFIPVHQSISSLTTSLVALKKRFQTNAIVYPQVFSGSYDAIYHIADGFTKFQLGVYRSDNAIGAGTFTVNRFSILPLGDVSGLVNFLDSTTVIE